MGYQLPEFDFAGYNPKDPWLFPPQRLVRFAVEAMQALDPYKARWVKERPHPDVRHVVYHVIGSELHSMVILAMMLRDKGLDGEWWAAQPEIGRVFPRHVLLANNIALRGSLQTGLLHQVVRQVDSCFRQLLHYMDLEAPNNSQLGFRGVWRQVLRQAGLKEYEALLVLLLALRDVAGNGGRFLPHNRKDLRVKYKGRVFEFKNDDYVEGVEQGFVDMWDMMLYVIREVAALLQLVFDSPVVAVLAFVPARHLDSSK